METYYAKEANDIYWSLSQAELMDHLKSRQLLFKCGFLEFVFNVLRDVLILKLSVFCLPKQIFEYLVNSVLINGFSNLKAHYFLWNGLLIIRIVAL